MIRGPHAKSLAEIKERILARCIWRDGPLDTPCLVWTGPVWSAGYGTISFKGKAYSVHRLIYLIDKGEIKKGLSICHKCDCLRCCNVEHLFTGTQRDNIRDSVSKGRFRRCDSENHGQAVLTKDEVSLIRYFLQNGWNCKELARRYGVNSSTVSSIKRKQTWRHVQLFQPIEGEPLPVPPPRKPKAAIDWDALLSTIPLNIDAAKVSP
jgi:HNH endonuclease